jgi:hypothetical protein
MTLRNAVFGLGVVFAVSVWSACRPDTRAAQAQSAADPVYSASEATGATGGNHDEAARRYKANQSTHWRQVALGTRGN